MHLLFVSGGEREIRLLEKGYLERLFTSESIKMGKHFDDPASKTKIPSFIKEFSIDMKDFDPQDPNEYDNFNQFFYRKLNKGARVIEGLHDPKVFVSPADCRTTAYETIDLAQQYWIKGDRFTIGSLIQDEAKASLYKNGAIILSRLAPQDYHRFHTPTIGTVQDKKDIKGNLFTVNPMAVNETLDVFTENKRSVIEIRHPDYPTPILFIAIGAMLVGSIHWTVETGAKVQKGDELGYFAYGGSTVITIFPPEMNVQISSDVQQNSTEKMETVLLVGDHVAKATS
jgi:phosphatidylserine decarboxylase